MNTSKNQDQGFTLVELLIVIVILGILATVTVFAVRGITDTGQENACNTEAKTVITASEAYYAENSGVLPPNTQALFLDGYLADEGATANFDLVANTGAADNGAVVTLTPLAGGDCATWTP